MESELLKIYCDKCNVEFNLNEDSVKTMDVKPMEVAFGIKRIQYFTCPACGFKYPIYLMDTVQEMYDKQIKRIRDYCDIRTAMDKTIPQSKIRQLKRALSGAREHQDDLRAEYLKTVTAQLNADYIEPLKDKKETDSETGRKEQE